jgi:hypothetical protein
MTEVGGNADGRSNSSNNKIDGDHSKRSPKGRSMSETERYMNASTSLNALIARNGLRKSLAYNIAASSSSTTNTADPNSDPTTMMQQ